MNVDASTPTTTDTANWPIFSGWPFHAWIQEQSERINRTALFRGAATVHNAYDRGGIDAAIERCIVGLAAADRLSADAMNRDDWDAVRLHESLWLGWHQVRSALIVLAVDREDGLIDAYNRPVVTA